MAQTLQCQASCKASQRPSYLTMVLVLMISYRSCQNTHNYDVQLSGFIHFWSLGTPLWCDAREYTICRDLSTPEQCGLEFAYAVTDFYSWKTDEESKRDTLKSLKIT